LVVGASRATLARKPVGVATFGERVPAAARIDDSNETMAV